MSAILLDGLRLHFTINLIEYLWSHKKNRSDQNNVSLCNDDRESMVSEYQLVCGKINAIRWRRERVEPM